MPFVVPGHKYRCYIGKQGAVNTQLEGTAATNPEFLVPVYSGPLKPMEERTAHEVADGEAYLPGQYKSRSWAEGTIDWSPIPQAATNEPSSLGRLFASHLGTNCDTVTGSADPWTHTMIRMDSLQFNTLWTGRPKPDGTFEYDKFTDSVTKTLEVTYSTGQPVHISTEVLAKKATTVATAPTPVETEVETATNYGLSWLGGTLLLDLATTPAATAARNFESFTITMSYSDLSLVNTDELIGRYWDIGRWSLGFSGTYVFEDWTAYNATFFGGTAPSANTDQSPNIVSGSLDFTFTPGPTANANRTLQIQMPSVDFAVEAPDVDPGGGGLRVTMTGVLRKPASGSPLVVKVKDGVATAKG